MTTQELRSYIDRILGNSLRVLLPSYWWKRLFGAIIDAVGSAESKAKTALTKTNELSTVVTEEKTSTVRISDDLENNKKVVAAITGGYLNNPVRVVYKNMVASYCTHYYVSNNGVQEFFCYVIFNDRSSLISETQREKTTVIRLHKDGTKEVKTYYNPIITSVDSILSAGSSNPVRNNVITSALGGKANVSDITRLEGYIDPIVLFVPAVGKSLPRILSSKNGVMMAYKKDLIERLKNNSDIHNPKTIAPRIVVFVCHETINNGTIETDEEYLLTQHEGLNVRVHEKLVGGYMYDCISADFVYSDGLMYTADVGGETVITKQYDPIDNEEVLAVALNDLNSRLEKLDEKIASAITNTLNTPV